MRYRYLLDRRPVRSVQAARARRQPAEALCDIVTACRTKGEKLPIALDQWESLKETIVGSEEHAKAKANFEHLPPFHFPIAFPEVFLRSRNGFDVLLGNPPWEKARVEEHAFWARQHPGLRSLPQRQYEKVRANLRKSRPDLVELLDEEVAEAAVLRGALLNGAYPGMGTGDPDLYKAFSWRFWNLVSNQGGWLSVVLPRSAFAAKGSTEFRVDVFRGSQLCHITMLINNRQWVFDSVHPQYTIGLAAICKKKVEQGMIALMGPFADLDRFNAGATQSPSTFSADDVCSWTDTSSLPLLPTEESLEIFAQMRKSPRLDLNDGQSWRARPYTELHATNDKSLMDLKSEDQPAAFWPVFKGESFDAWEPDTGRYYAWADPNVVLPELQRTRLRGLIEAMLAGSGLSNSPAASAPLMIASQVGQKPWELSVGNCRLTRSRITSTSWTPSSRIFMG